MPLTQQAAILDYFQNEAPILYLRLKDDGEVIATNNYCQMLLGASIVGCSFGELLVDFQRSFNLRDYIDTAHSLLSLKIPNSLPRSFLFTFRQVKDCILVFGKSDN